MTRVLVVYASHYGQTRSIAMAIAQRLRSLGHDVSAADANGPVPAPTGFDVVVLGSRIELGRHAGSLLSYIRAHRDDLAHPPTAFFSVSMSASDRDAGADPSGYLAATFDALGWRPTLAIAFGGGLPYRKYGRIVRFVMKRISKAAGHTTDTSRNHDFTDWTAVDAFADRIDALHPASYSHSPNVARSEPATGARPA